MPTLCAITYICIFDVCKKLQRIRNNLFKDVSNRKFSINPNFSSNGNDQLSYYLSLTCCFEERQQTDGVDDTNWQIETNFFRIFPRASAQESLFLIFHFFGLFFFLYINVWMQKNPKCLLKFNLSKHFACVCKFQEKKPWINKIT